MNHYEQIQSKIVTRQQAQQQVAQWQKAGEKIVFSNGCFDLVHRGHVEYLSLAANKGTKLVLGLNTDASVSRLKGPLRPLVDEQSRAFLLAAFSFIDLVVLFDEETPYDLIKAIQPDVLVKGSDYKPEEIVGYDIVTGRGGTVETVDLVEGFSTTNLVKKIKETH
ncbi:D-glycero-beta-D-manno-heptose 1-phosphate adenylyltransferase [Breznakibacter xylanolyticus]|nr:D-glycero-beta-D-manno-heptose 1-phosphate adenylyltransferase [Breznakibacter xylanolyticus]MBN2743174.1 D-glycero-beta-D-manno-heptose 1-phosphate adenylyltransferase [Marinilabiliaceae bacterium]